jgi:hypothetical protein
MGVRIDQKMNLPPMILIAEVLLYFVLFLDLELN